MRNIKFRAYVKNRHNAMCRVESINFCGDNKYDVLIRTADLFKNPTAALEYLVGQSIGNTEFKLMQYTGLKDKNGKEIYEGDIIKKIGDIKTYSIVFDGVLAAYLMDDGTGGYGLNQMLLRDFEVIGNIYESPDLIGEYDGD